MIETRTTAIPIASPSSTSTRLASARISSQSGRFAILALAVTMLAIGLDAANAEVCDYKTCGALMARDGGSWGIAGGRDYAPDTKRACAELNACLRRAKTNSAGRAVAAPAAGPSSMTVLSLEPADKPTKGMQPAPTSAVHETSSTGIPAADRSNGMPTRCFAVAEILVSVDCSPSGPQPPR
jgi:hypothetical protein